MQHPYLEQIKRELDEGRRVWTGTVHDLFEIIEQMQEQCGRCGSSPQEQDASAARSDT